MIIGSLVFWQQMLRRHVLWLVALLVRLLELRSRQDLRIKFLLFIEIWSTNGMEWEILIVFVQFGRYIRSFQASANNSSCIFLSIFNQCSITKRIQRKFSSSSISLFVVFPIQIPNNWFLQFLYGMRGELASLLMNTVSQLQHRSSKREWEIGWLCCWCWCWTTLFFPQLTLEEARLGKDRGNEWTLITIRWMTMPKRRK